MRKWLQFPWYIFLLPLFYILHRYNEYYSLIEPKIVSEYLFYYLVLGLVSFLISLSILKNRIKAGMLTVIFLSIFFFFGAAHDFLKSLRLPGFLVSFKFLLCLIAVILVAASIYFKRNKPFTKVNRFLLLLFCMLTLMELGISFYYAFSGKQKEMDLAGNNNSEPGHLQTLDKSAAPDIFFFVFDAYASTASLKKYLHFDNSQLDTLLKRNGFFISSASLSNYNSTSLSIASTLNMQYFRKDLENIGPTAKTLLRGALSLKKSFLPKLLQDAGYNIINYGVFNIENYPVSVKRVFYHFEVKVFLLETLWGRIRRDIWWNVIAAFRDIRTMPPDMEFIDRNKKNCADFLNELSKESDSPRFVIGHALMPHRPFYLDSSGNPRYTINTDLTDKNHDSLYLNQVRYINTIIDSFANTATKKYSRPRVVIIEGDHGVRYGDWALSIREKQFMNLNAYYFSDGNYSMLYDSISPVNSFRVVLNKYFHTGLPLLKDSTIRL